MQGLKDSIYSLKDNTKGLIDDYVSLAKIEVAEKSSNILSLLIVIVLALALAVFFLFFTGIALSIWIGNLIDNEIAGYLIIGFVYLILAIVLIFVRKSLILPPIAKSIIKKIYG